MPFEPAFRSPRPSELLTQECPKPISEEFRQIVGEYQMGKPLERTLTEAKERLRSENFILFAAALLASRESGGRLNETVERISTSVLEVQRLERKVRSETAQARKSAVYMAIIPLFLLIVLFIYRSGQCRVVLYGAHWATYVDGRGRAEHHRLRLGRENPKPRYLIEQSRA